MFEMIKLMKERAGSLANRTVAWQDKSLPDVYSGLWTLNLFTKPDLPAKFQKSAFSTQLSYQSAKLQPSLAQLHARFSSGLHILTSQLLCYATYTCFTFGLVLLASLFRTSVSFSVQCFISFFLTDNILVACYRTVTLGTGRLVGSYQNMTFNLSSCFQLQNGSPNT